MAKDANAPALAGDEKQGITSSASPHAASNTSPLNEKV